MWSEPYFDEGGGNVLMTTLSVPFHRGETKNLRRRGHRGHLPGLAQDLGGQDLRLQLRLRLPPEQERGVVAHPEKRYLMRESIFSLAESMDSPTLREIGRPWSGQGGLRPAARGVHGQAGLGLLRPGALHGLVHGHHRCPKTNFSPTCIP
jgi:sigma-B regulation protein RsbU (phosphoserine phosphatase)